ncbi:nucleotide-binding protein, partial [Acetobacter fallax]
MSQSTFASLPRPYAKALRTEFFTENNVTTQQSSPGIIAVASGKGGVGKTWFSLTLAHALLRENREHRILVVDGDFGLGNVDIQLGLNHKFDIKRWSPFFGQGDKLSSGLNEDGFYGQGYAETVCGRVQV